jgi:FdhE protein
MTASATALNGLKRQRPEWEPWLAVVEEVLRQAATPTWDVAVPIGDPLSTEAPGANAATRPTTVPLLAGATISLHASSVRRLLERLIHIASQSRTPKMATLAAVLRADLDVLPLFAASLCQDSARVEEVAVVSGADAEALQAVVALLAVPFLHACTRRRASSICESWVEGYCPLCGSWPTFAEVRGIERNHYFRCGRCGGDWHAHVLHCPYCSMSNHNQLVALVPENGGSHAVINACTRCGGYVKTFTRLQGCPPGTVMLEDLASVELDVAAMGQGYTRPAGTGYLLEVRVNEKEAGRRRFFAWNA